MPRVICAGLIAADLVFDVSSFPVRGTKNRATASKMITGGGALNAASAIAGLGGDASLAGAIGDDIFGAFLSKKMADRRIDDQFVSVVPGVPTSRSANMLTPDGDRTIINHREPALSVHNLTLPDVFGFDAALVDTRWPEGVTLIVEAARNAGKPAIVDAEAPVAQSEQVLARASHVVFSEQGLDDYCGGSDAAGLTLAQKRLGNWCAVTRGPLPVLCHDGRRLTEVSPYPTAAVNTLGAGDVWHGAFALALSRGKSEIDAVHWANAAASLKVSRPLNDETLPTTADVDALVASRSAHAAEGSQ